MAYHNESIGRKKARDLLSRTGHHMGMLGGHMRSHTADAMAGGDHSQDAAMIRKAFKEHDDQLHGGKKTRLNLASGGIADGFGSEARADRAPRGRKKGGGAKNHIAIVIAPQGGGQQAAPQPVPIPVPIGGAGAPPMARPPAALPPGPPPGGAMPPPGMPPVMPGPLPGGPMMRKSGGAVSRHKKKVHAPKPPGRAESTAADMPPAAQAPGEAMPLKLERPGQEIETASAQDDSFAPPGMKRGGAATGSGRVPNMTAGSGSGEGRQQKSAALDYCGGGRAR